jgi:CxxC-x17-CxxC domain-containing protein
MKDSRAYREARDRFVALLENPNSLEREWQRLFTECPFILTDCLSLGIEPKELIPCKPGRAEADFYFYPESKNPLSPYGVVEIKRPSTTILSIPRKNVICLAAEANTAVRQAQEYAAELKAEIARWNSILFFGNHLQMLVIAGLSKEIAKKVTNDILRSQLERLLPPECMLVPFDVLSEALAARVPPCLHMVVPWYPVEEEAIAAPSPSLDLEPNKPGTGFGGKGRRDFGPRELQDTVCSDCGKSCTVPIGVPEGKPLYCSECYSKHRPKRF